MRKRTIHSFTLVFEGADVTDANALDAFFEAGCEDALFGERDGVAYAHFDREAPTFARALRSGLDQLESVPGVRVVRAEPDDLVSASVIAERTSRSRESVRLLIEGRRGPGGFPPPVAWVDAKTRLWQWSDVARWFGDALGETSATHEGANFVAALNGALEVRSRAPRLEGDDERTTLAKVLLEDAYLVAPDYVEDSVAARLARDDADQSVPWSRVRE